MQKENTPREEKMGTTTSLKIDRLTFEDKQNLIGFFSLLLQVDKRINPQNYKPQKTKNA